ncbi:hypothetical protein MYAM1_002310 [Malassezia yamatoensis]|uniref:Pep3/Vps18/deep orange domain-containing protein n=1 Tax=Malassezia yamatoensis TaxID=253288 RepID=A0AAJ6CHS8_9BASI|nr:hypothetical protein MYAM1_002310 [Malassezia yamatoensis]
MDATSPTTQQLFDNLSYDNLEKGLPDEPPLFQLGQVRYALDSSLIKLCVASNKMFLCMEASDSMSSTENALMRLVCIDLENPTNTAEGIVSMPPIARSQRAASSQDAQFFVDPSGFHVLVSLSTGHTFYWSPLLMRARILPRLNGLIVTSVTWAPYDPSLVTRLSSGSSAKQWMCSPRILLGTTKGEIWETVCCMPIPNGAPDKSTSRPDFFDRIARKTSGAQAEYTGPVERYLERVFIMSEPQSIQGLHLDTLDVQKERRVFVVATTCTRIYEFSGCVPSTHTDHLCLYHLVFEPYRDTLLSALRIELPSDHENSQLVCTRQTTLPDNQCTLAWLTGAGLFHAILNFSVAPTEDFIEKSGLLNHEGAPPEFLAKTAFHYVLVYKDRVECVSTITEDLVWSKSLPIGIHEQLLGASMDVVKGTCWIYTSAQIFELIVTNESRNVWEIWLDRKNFEEALKYSPNEGFRSEVLACQGDEFMAQGAFMEAARVYTQTKKRSFEQVALAFEENNALEALLFYVTQYLATLPLQEKISRMMLASLSVELYLAELNRVEESQAFCLEVDQTSEPEEMIKSKLIQLFHTYKAALNRKATYQLLSRQGREDLLVAYAEAIHDTAKILQRRIEQSRFDDALRLLSSQSDLELYYNSATTLLKHHPANTVICWSRQTALDPVRLIPALLQYRPTKDEPNYAVNYLKEVVYQQNDTAMPVHNLLITMLVGQISDDTLSDRMRQDARESLQQLIEGTNPNQSTYYDANYALRLCIREKLHDACVRLYARMGRHENAVKLALEADDIELACKCAESAPSVPLRKDLWLKCARHVVQTKEGVDKVLQFLQRTSLLSLEDILPFFPDFVVIDGFKEEICNTLDAYVERIANLKAEMERTTRNADNIQQDLQSLSSRFLSLDLNQLCVACHAPLLQRQLYLFPCRHGFHADCLTREVTNQLPPRLLRRLLQLQEELKQYMQPEDPSADGTHSKDTSLSTAPVLAGMVNAGVQGLTGTLKLDKLREHVRPQAIVDAISTGINVSVAGGRRVFAPLDLFSESRLDENASMSGDANLHPSATSSGKHLEARQHSAAFDAARSEMNSIIAGACPVCTLSVQQVAFPFVDQAQHDAQEQDAWAI